MRIGGSRVWPFAGARWILRITSIPFTTPAERREALAVRVAPSAMVELRLRADADEEVARGGVRPGSRHREGAVHVPQPRVARALEPNRRVLGALLLRRDARLHDRDLHRVPGLVVRPHGTVEAAAVVAPLAHVVQEVRGGHRRARDVDLELDVAELRRHEHVDRRARARAEQERHQGERGHARSPAEREGDGSGAPTRALYAATSRSKPTQKA